MYTGDGSSPRVRGKRIRPGCVPVAERLIPARAGKTFLLAGRLGGPLAHPRACGENQLDGQREAQAGGSSPRVRGKRQERRRRRPHPGLIPARAGKTFAGRGRRPWRRAHPRACGENLAQLRSPDRVKGSSPRVRGKPLGDHFGLGAPGLIPACAGKTGSCSASWPRRWAHPRVCGENAPSLDALTVNAGSSPRVRGKHPGLQSSDPVRRLIPARAGKTARASRSPPSPVAHPRVCGENSDIARLLRIDADSSPRVRGKRENLARSSLHLRLIPARAGKTPTSSATAPGGRAHPRACGENAEESASGLCCAGSSPRVRGKRAGCPQAGAGLRLIPARAGKTRHRGCAGSSRRAHPRACGENKNWPAHAVAP